MAADFGSMLKISLNEYYCNAWTLRKNEKKKKPKKQATLPKFLQQEMGNPGIFFWL